MFSFQIQSSYEKTVITIHAPSNIWLFSLWEKNTCFLSDKVVFWNVLFWNWKKKKLLIKEKSSRTLFKKLNSRNFLQEENHNFYFSEPYEILIFNMQLLLCLAYSAKMCTVNRKASTQVSFQLVDVHCTWADGTSTRNVGPVISEPALWKDGAAGWWHAMNVPQKEGKKWEYLTSFLRYLR